MSVQEHCPENSRQLGEDKGTFPFRAAITKLPVRAGTH